MSNPASPPDFAIETGALTKIYAARGHQPARKALDEVSLTVPRGSFFGLLGPNGAGKSTFINILAGLVSKSSGFAKVWGAEVAADERAVRCAIGVVPQELNLDPFFTPRELLDVQAGLYGVPRHERRTDEILDAVGLADKAHAYARTLSGGMRRRLLVAKAMVHSPPILVLDEPTAGVDIELRRQLWSYVRKLNGQGTTVVLTTHYLEEAEELCDRIAIIDRGGVVAHEEKHALLARLDSKQLIVTIDRDLNEWTLPEVLAPWSPECLEGRRLRFRYKPSAANAGRILDGVRAAGLGVVDLSTVEADLEDIFLRLTGHNGVRQASDEPTDRP